MEKNKKRVFTGTVAMLVILFGLLRIAIFTGYHMVTPFLPEIARNLDTTIVVIGLAISIRSAMGFLGPVWGGIIDLFGKKNSLLIALLTFAASYAAIYFFPSFPCFVVALPISYAARTRRKKAHISTDFRSYSRIKMPWQPFLPARF